MIDRPTAEELLEAVQMHIQTHIIPVIKQNRKLYFQTLVAVNVLKIVGREFVLISPTLKSEWERLNTLLGDDAPIPERRHDFIKALEAKNGSLADDIRAGNYDLSEALLDHLMENTIDQLSIANPDFLHKVFHEMDNPSLDAWSNR
ncbi:MAG TPA: DUF6285 domain-containing protein [Aggregatilineales bacterium]|nr:DUF6285 domain-containing protein [Aggregatilineales bacterium]